mmetsp:Transcript_12473/g.30322  ORF Transcript_12473/g.30322 Transcript_12473/m.30322 type:complete len:269 (+) Transcript_12473:476-1282(+)
MTRPAPAAESTTKERESVVVAIRVAMTRHEPATRSATKKTSRRAVQSALTHSSPTEVGTDSTALTTSALTIWSYELRRLPQLHRLAPRARAGLRVRARETVLGALGHSGRRAPRLRAGQSRIQCWLAEVLRQLEVCHTESSHVVAARCERTNAGVARRGVRLGLLVSGFATAAASLRAAVRIVLVVFETGSGRSLVGAVPDEAVVHSVARRALAERSSCCRSTCLRQERFILKKRVLVQHFDVGGGGGERHGRKIDFRRRGGGKGEGK